MSFLIAHCAGILSSFGPDSSTSALWCFRWDGGTVSGTRPVEAGGVRSRSGWQSTRDVRISLAPCHRRPPFSSLCRPWPLLEFGEPVGLRLRASLRLIVKLRRISTTAPECSGRGRSKGLCACGWRCESTMTRRPRLKTPRSANAVTRLNQLRLELPTGAPNLDALRAFMRECLAPLLAEEFVRRRQSAPGLPISEVHIDDPTIAPLYREGGPQRPFA